MRFCEKAGPSTKEGLCDSKVVDRRKVGTGQSGSVLVENLNMDRGNGSAAPGFFRKSLECKRLCLAPQRFAAPANPDTNFAAREKCG